MTLLTQCDTATYRLRYTEPYNRHISKECHYKSPVTNPTTSQVAEDGTKRYRTIAPNRWTTAAAAAAVYQYTTMRVKQSSTQI